VITNADHFSGSGRIAQFHAGIAQEGDETFHRIV
jgi:hypothetical protein